jgi:hypothetical protein
MTGRRNDFALRASFDPQTPGCPGSSMDFGPLKRYFRFPLNILDREPPFVVSQQNWSLVSETCQKRPKWAVLAMSVLSPR